MRGTIERAKQMAKSGDVAGAKALLVRLYTDPEVQTDEKRQAPFVIMKELNDYDTALQMTRDAYMKGGPNSVKAGADYAMILMLKGGHDDEAAQVLSQISASGLVNTSNREDLTAGLHHAFGAAGGQAARTGRLRRGVGQDFAIS